MKCVNGKIDILYMRIIKHNIFGNDINKIHRLRCAGLFIYQKLTNTNETVKKPYQVKMHIFQLF